MDPQKLQLLQMFGGIGTDSVDAALADIIKSNAVEKRSNAAVKVQESGIVDPKIQKWIFTGKFE